MSTKDVNAADPPATPPKPARGAAIVVVALLLAASALVLLVNVFGTTNTRASVDGKAATTALPLDDQ